MLLFNVDWLLSDPFGFFLFFSSIAVALIIAISVHEFSHAAAATLQGDLTAKRMGRLTLNPKAHLDPMGTVLIALVGFGWGRPVPVNPSRLKNGRRGMAFVSAAGPASNVVLAVALATVFQLGILDMAKLPRNPFFAFDPLIWLTITGFFLVQLNLTLAVFNLIPVPPLDGGGILGGIAPRAVLPAMRQLQRISMPVLMVLFFLSFVTNLSPFGFIFGPLQNLAFNLVGD
jgi:Zn-dependent protease